MTDVQYIVFEKASTGTVKDPTASTTMWRMYGAYRSLAEAKKVVAELIKTLSFDSILLVKKIDTSIELELG